MPTERNFGFTVGEILWQSVACAPTGTASLGATSTVLIVIAAVLLGLAALSPALLRWPNILWSKLGELLFVVINPVVMFAVYVTTFVPIGIYLRSRARILCFEKSIDPPAHTGTHVAWKVARLPTSPINSSIPNQCPMM